VPIPTSLSKALIVLLAAASALGPGSMEILLPALPLIKDTFQVSNDIAQLTLSLSMLAIALGTLFYGPVSDKYGRKPVMLLGLSITIIGSVFCFLASSIELLILGRLIQAFGGAAGLVLARAIVRDVYSAQEAGRVMATLIMVMVVVPMFSPALGGELIQHLGLKYLFVVTAIASIFILILLLVRLPETLKEPVPFSGIGAMLNNYILLLKSRAFRGYAFSVTFTSVVFFSFISAAPEIMVSVLNRPPTEYGYYFIMIPLGFMAGNYFSRHYGGQMTLDTMISIGTGISLIGVFAAIALQLSGYHQPIALFAPIAFTVLGNGITLPNAQTAAINEFPQFAGSASGLSGFLQMSVSAIATQLVAVIFNGSVYPLLFLMLCASIISMACFYFAAGFRSAATA